MKQSVFISILLLTGFICSSCMENTEDLFPGMNLEISPDTKSQVIKKELNGITFEFCLLNEQGQPATVFKEGENFSFYFSVTNKRNGKIIYVPEIARSNENPFCKVFNSNNQDLGKPYISGAINMIGIAAYSLDINERCEFEQQWYDERDDWQWEHTHFRSSHRDFLKKGDYYTEIKHKFEFFKIDDGATEFYINPGYFKINFQIK